MSIKCPEVWLIDLIRFQGPNMVSCELVTGNLWMPSIGEYLPASMLNHITDLEEDLIFFLVRYPILLGDINADIGRLCYHRDLQILVSFRLLGFMAHLRQRL